MEENNSLENGSKEQLNPHVFFDIKIGESKGNDFIYEYKFLIFS